MNVYKKILVLFILFTLSYEAKSQCNHPDYVGLMAFYNNTGGANWVNNTGWKEGAAGTNCNPCNGWFGVYCDGNSRVVGIILTRNNLIGTLSPDLSKIRFLQSINLSINGFVMPGHKANNISGSIPTEISNLQDMVYIDFTGNNLTGELPLSIYNLKNLGALLLGDNNLSGILSPNIEKLSKLQVLLLNGNEFTGVIPSEIGKLTDLVKLSLYSNKFSEHEIPATFSGLKNLEELFLSHCNLTGRIPEVFGQMTKLKYVSFDSNKLIGEIPESIYNCTSLRTIVIQSNLISGVISDKIRNLQNLEQLLLTGNKISGSLPPGIFELKNLQNLYLSFNLFSNWELPADINKLKRLRSLGLSSTNLSGNLPAELADLDSLSNIMFDNNNLSGCFPSSYKKFCGNIAEFYGNSKLPWTGDFTEFCLTDGSTNSQVGAYCNDGFELTSNDMIYDGCFCLGNLADTCYITYYDTIQVFDTLFVNVYDTLHVTDTLLVNVYDTIITTITQTISVTDTLIINLNIPDSSNDPVLNRIIVYPNPASSHMYIDFGNHTLMQNYTCQILNALGQPVFFTPVDQKLYYLDLSTWSGKGTYFIRIINDFGQTVETKKIILQ